MDESQTPEVNSRRKALGKALGGGRTDAGMKPSAGASSQTPRNVAKPAAASATALVRVTSHAVRHRKPPQLLAKARSYTESANRPSSGAALASAPSLT